MSDDSPLQPEWERLGIPEDDSAEPADAGGDHFGESPKQDSLWNRFLNFINPSRRGDGS